MDIDDPAATLTINLLLSSIDTRLEEAARIARAATACAEAGSTGEAVTLALDLEQPVYEASRLLDAASLLYRLKENPSAKKR